MSLSNELRDETVGVCDDRSPDTSAQEQRTRNTTNECYEDDGMDGAMNEWKSS